MNQLIKETGKHSAFFGVAMSVLGGISYQPIVAWAEDVVTTKVNARVDAIQTTQDEIRAKQSEIQTEQKVIQQQVEGVDEKLQLLIQMMQQR